MNTTERIVEAVMNAIETANMDTYNNSTTIDRVRTAIESVIGQESMKIDEMADAMREFCERVEKGEIRSVKTYNKFKSILSDLTPPKTKEDGE